MKKIILTFTIILLIIGIYANGETNIGQNNAYSSIRITIRIPHLQNNEYAYEDTMSHFDNIQKNTLQVNDCYIEQGLFVLNIHNLENNNNINITLKSLDNNKTVKQINFTINSGNYNIKFKLPDNEKLLLTLNDSYSISKNIIINQ